MQNQVLTSHKQRIRNILKSEHVDRIGILDLDIEFFSEGNLKESEKFSLFCFDGPFQGLSSRYGLQEALTRFIQQPRHALSSFRERLRHIIAEYQRLKDNGLELDGVWMWEDIAYDRGPYFSIEKYRSRLLGPHRDLSDFFYSEGLPLFFHCDGNVEDLIPLLAGAKVSAVHPVQEKSNPGLLRLKRDLRGCMTFVGGVGLYRLGQDREALAEYIKMLKEGGNYIFSFDGPLPLNLNRQDYDKLIKDIEAQGAYR